MAFRRLRKTKRFYSGTRVAGSWELKLPGFYTSTGTTQLNPYISISNCCNHHPSLNTHIFDQFATVISYIIGELLERLFICDNNLCFKGLPQNEMTPPFLFHILIVDLMPGSGMISINLGIESFPPTYM